VHSQISLGATSVCVVPVAKVAGASCVGETVPTVIAAPVVACLSTPLVPVKSVDPEGKMIVLAVPATAGGLMLKSPEVEPNSLRMPRVVLAVPIECVACPSASAGTNRAKPAPRNSLYFKDVSSYGQVSAVLPSELTSPVMLSEHDVETATAGD
jgi:hypothetical protein